MPPDLTHSFQCQLAGGGSSSGILDQQRPDPSLRPKWAEDIDEDTAEETSYWKILLEISPSFVWVGAWRVESGPFFFLFPGSSVSHGSLEKQQIECNQALRAKGE